MCWNQMVFVSLARSCQFCLKNLISPILPCPSMMSKMSNLGVKGPAQFTCSKGSPAKNGNSSSDNGNSGSVHTSVSLEDIGFNCQGESKSGNASKLRKILNEASGAVENPIFPPEQKPLVRLERSRLTLCLAYTSPTSKLTTKRGRGRPKGTRTTCPRGPTTATYKPSPGRGATTRGRRRAKGNRTIRGHQSVGRGKRKRSQWENESESEEEEETASSELEEPAASLGEIGLYEEEEQETEEQENKNGAESFDELESKEEPKPPIKLRIIRRNDTDAFVSKVDSESNNVTDEMLSDTPATVFSNQLSPKMLEHFDKDADIQPILSEQDTSISQQLPIKRESPVEQYTTIEEDKAFQTKPIVSEETPSLPIEAMSGINSIPIAPPTNAQHQQRKSSIFKRDPLASSKSKKGLALYRHTWHEDDARKVSLAGADGVSVAATLLSNVSNIPSEEQQHSHVSPWSIEAQQKPNHSSEQDEDDEFTEESGTVRCSRKVKDYYTVVRNVKKAHQIQESGEFQEFNDDVDYILDALQDRNPTATRCLSAMSLASKCMEPAFRMHLRAHSTVAKFFQALKDAPSKASVALCTSCIMFVLTQDRLNMDLDRDSLELMLNLLEIDAGQVDPVESKELEKNKLKVRELCEEMVRKGHAPHLQLDKITAAQLAMETLLSLTSKKAGEWFKEELRVLGGLDHIIQTVTVCTALLSPASEGVSSWEWDKSRLDALKKVDRCLRVLENVTFQNEENQNYLMEFSNGRLVDATLNLLKLLSREVAAYWPLGTKDSLSQLLSETLSNLMKVVMNLTHDSNDDSVGSQVYGDKTLTWDATLVCLLQTSICLPEDKSFDVMTLALGILINLVERSSVNRDRLMIATVPPGADDIFDAKPLAIKALIDLFVNKEESARLEEARTDEILDGKPDQNDRGSGQSSAIANAGKTQEDAMEETVKKLLHKAGRHMEDSMVAAYVALLLGYVVMKNEAYELQVKELLPEKMFTQMVIVLKKFYEFLKLTANSRSIDYLIAELEIPRLSIAVGHLKRAGMPALRNADTHPGIIIARP
nr:EOG090X017M [Megafenestra aurita]